MSKFSLYVYMARAMGHNVANWARFVDAIADEDPTEELDASDLIDCMHRLQILTPEQLKESMEYRRGGV